MANSGNFVETVRRLWTRSDAEPASPFAGFLRFSDWLHARVGRTDGIALPRLAEMLFRFLVDELGCGDRDAALAIWRDWQRAGRRDPPEFIRTLVREMDASAEADPVSSEAARRLLPKRQARHLGERMSHEP